METSTWREQTQHLSRFDFSVLKADFVWNQNICELCCVETTIFYSEHCVIQHNVDLEALSKSLYLPYHHINIHMWVFFRRINTLIGYH